jgi:hypothetical protein
VWEGLYKMGWSACNCREVENKLWSERSICTARWRQGRSHWRVEVGRVKLWEGHDCACSKNVISCSMWY